MYNDPNNPYRKNSQQPRQPNQPSIPPIAPQRPDQPNFRLPMPNRPHQPYNQAAMPNRPNPPYNQTSMPDQSKQPNNRTAIPNQPTQPIPPTPFKLNNPQPERAPRTGAWSWYKRQKNIAKLGMGCLLVVAVLILASAAAFGITANAHIKAISTVAPTSVAKQAANPTSAPAQAPARIVTFGDGTHLVGKEIQPGTYRIRKAAANCYYARLSGLDGTTNEIIANNTTNVPAIITIAATDKAFQSTNCGIWTTDTSAITSNKTSFGDGIYLIGTDIQPGTYKNSAHSGCYFARTRGFSGTIEDIIANTNTNTSTVVTITPTDKGFQSINCGTWTRQ